MKTKNMCRVALLLAVACASIMVAGCPRTTQLQVTPSTIVFSENLAEQRLTLSNLGNRAVDWTLETLVRNSEEAEWSVGAIEWLEISKLEGSLAPGVEHITLTVSRLELQPGTYSNVALRVNAPNFQHIVPVSLVVAPLLRTTPEVVTLQAGALSAQFRLENRGNTAVNWVVHYFEGMDTTVPATDLPPDMILIPSGGTLARQSSINVKMEWTQLRPNFGLRISIPGSPGHDAVVQFRFGVPLTDLIVEPASLRLFYSQFRADTGADTTQPASPMTLRNIGRRSLQWSLTFRTSGVAVDQTDMPIEADTISGVLPAGDFTTVLVRVIDPDHAIPGAGNYELAIEAVDQDGVLIVPIILEAVSLPVIIASDPPDQNSLGYTLKRTLDFGRDSLQQEFWVVNIGPLESRLFFRVRHDDEGIANPLIADVTPITGDTNGSAGVFAVQAGRLVDARRVVVTIDRTVMDEDVEYRKLYIEAWDEDGEARLDMVAPWEMQIRVERPPMTVQGALNRSRPPYLMRFVFLLRDTLGSVIPTRTPEDLAKLDFSITEEGKPLDLNEASYRVEGPEQLKVNLVVMLDYTGSMYYAGVDDPAALRRPGDVLNEIRAAVALFLDDLPPSYRVALMYHNDRQPLNRLIHPFSTNRESLKAALRNFEVPPQLHGSSDIWDALIDAIDRIAAEDSTDTLPFDDADVRAVVFISDGNDNSSESDAGGAASAAKDQRVALYPLAYSAGVGINYPDLISVAEGSSGHFYNAGTTDRLVRLLGNRRSLVLKPTAFDATQATAEFKVYNAGKGPLTWYIIEDQVVPWLTGIAPASGVTAPGGESLISISVNPNNVTSPYGVGKARLAIQSNDGLGEVEVTLALQPGTSTIQQLSLSLRDEPGMIWEEMQNQVVLSYVTPSESGGTYSIRIDYTQPDGTDISGYFEEAGMFYPGDVRAGQISMYTTGIDFNYAAETWEDVARAEIYVRADYVPRFVNLFRMRFMTMLGENVPPAVETAFWQHIMKVELAPEGLLVYPISDPTPNWRLVPENDGVYRMLTAREFALPYASSGNLLRITLTNLWPFVEAADAAGIDPEFFMDMRVDNSIYYAPGTNTRPSETVYFLYPSGPLNPDRPLRIAEGADLAAPSKTVADLMAPGIDAEALGAWDRDDDGLLDFMDPWPDDDSRPGRLTRPSIIRFVQGALTVDVTLINNRLDRFTWSPEILTSGNLLTPDHFRWSVLDANSIWIQLGAGEVPSGTLLPGEMERLRLHLLPGALPAGPYTAQLLIDTDVYGVEVTSVEVQL